MPPVINKPFPGVIHLVFQNQTTLTKAFMRMQEFYESPFGDERGSFRGRLFSRDEFKAAYAKENGTGTGYGEFSYYTDWNGFNVPGDVADKFMELFTPDFMEEYMVAAIKQSREPGQPYYVIGTHSYGDTTTIDHELSHAFFHLDEFYRRGVMDMVTPLPSGFRRTVNDSLKEMGYYEDVFDDELAAYLSTSNMYDIDQDFHYDNTPWHRVLGFQKHFYEYLKKKLKAQIEDDNNE